MCKLESGRNGLINQALNLEPFLVAMLFLTETEHLAIGSMQGGVRSGAWI